MDPSPPAQTSPKTSALAIWSLVLGILSLLCFTIFGAIPAVICGHISLSRIRRSAGALSGSGLAIGGLVTGYIALALSIFMVPMFLAIAIPNFVKARQTAQAHACAANLRLIDSAKHAWASANHKQTNDVPTELDLANYFPNGMPKCPTGGTYTINAVGVPPTCSISKHNVGDRWGAEPSNSQ